VSVALACTWRPRGELPRLQRLRPQLEEVYERIVVALPPDVDLDAVGPLRAWPVVQVVVSPRPFWGRYLAIQTALEAPAARVTHVHYADLDLLLHWIEVQPEEWRQTVARIQAADCLVAGRTERAFRTRPQAIQQTERIINLIGSYLLGQPVDLGLGSRGFSRRAAAVVIANSAPGGFGDAEWPVLLRRAGFAVEYVEVDGGEWESPDFYRDEVADEDTRRRAAEAYDQRPEAWAARVRTALEIIGEGLAAAARDLPAAAR
jgi:hypothetical protein